MIPQYLLPIDRNAWLDFLVKLVKKKVCVHFLSDQDLRSVISAARYTVARKFSSTQPDFDPDLPEAYYWDEFQVSKWIAENGYPYLKEAFLINHISGRKLVNVDASALCKMGLKYFDDIKDVAGKIRELLGIPRPNMMRALARLVPMELFLRKRLVNGRTYDLLNFKAFCEEMGFPYEHLIEKDNKNANIPCTVKVMIYLGESLMSPAESDGGSENFSLMEADSVEFYARHAAMRNRLVQRIIEEILEMVFNPSMKKQHLALDTMNNLLYKGLHELGLDDLTSGHGKERVEFAMQVGRNLIEEMLKTTKVLQDIQNTRRNLKRNIKQEEYEDMKLAAELFLEDVMPIAALLSLGELDLEPIFRQEPEFEYFVDEIVQECEDITNELVPEAENFIDEVIAEAKLRIISKLYPELSMDTVRSAHLLVDNLLDDLIENAVSIPQDEVEKMRKFSGKRRSQDGNNAEAEFERYHAYLSKTYLESWKKMGTDEKDQKSSGKSLINKQEKKYDKDGNPILENLDSNELLQIIQSLASTSSLTPSKEKIVQEAFVEQSRRRALKLQKAIAQHNYERQFPGKLDEVGQYREFNVQEKFNRDGTPILSRLNSKELQEIIETGKIKSGDGRELNRQLNVETIAQAKEELEKRQREAIHDQLQLNNYQRTFPVTTTSSFNSSSSSNSNSNSTGEFREYTPSEKINSLTKLPILSRLTMDELEHLIQFREFKTIPSSTFSIPLAILDGKTLSELISLAKAEKHKREEADIQDAMKVKFYRRAHPGYIDEHGAYHEWSKDGKFDDKGKPILDRLNMDELNQIIDKGTVNMPEGSKVIDSGIISMAKGEKRMREQEEEEEKVHLEQYRKKFPGKVVNGIFREFSSEEKIDSQGAPILERLTAAELDDLIEKREFNNTSTTFSISNRPDLIDKARLERESREQAHLQSKLKKQLYRKEYPGKIVDGVFKEFTIQEKFDSTNSNSIIPILERLNNDELKELVTTGFVITPYSGKKKIVDQQLLEKANDEMKLREQEVVQGKLQEKMYMRKPLLIKNRIADYRQQYKPEDKFDTKGNPIVERLTNEDLEEIIKSSSILAAGKKYHLAPELIQEAIFEKAVRDEEERQFKETSLYHRQFPRSRTTIFDEESLHTRPKLEEFLQKFEEDKKRVDADQEKTRLEKESIEQKRLELIDALKKLVEAEKAERERQRERDAEEQARNKTSVANLALFNGFVIDDVSNVVGAVDPFDGKVRNQNGSIIGIINSDGILFTNDGLSIGKVGADVEQIAVGKFRALPKEIPSILKPEESKSLSVVNVDGAIAKIKALLGEDEKKKIAGWNAHQAQVKGGILVQKGHHWVRENTFDSGENDSENGPSSAFSSTMLARQIQETEGFKPSQVILLDAQSIAELQQENQQKQEKQEDDKPFVWKRHEKKKKQQPTEKPKTLTARMLQGEAVVLPTVNKSQLIQPIPVSGRWGVQVPPDNLDKPHSFKPPPPTIPSNSMDTSPRTSISSGPYPNTGSRVHDILTKVQTGEAKRLVDAEGSTIGEIKKDGHIYASDGEHVGYMQKNGVIVKSDGEPMKETGIKVIRQNGVVLGEVNDDGKLALKKDKDRFLIGMIWGDGRIVTLDNKLVGYVLKDGRIMGGNDKPIGLFTPTWELLGTDGIPFAYVSAEGKVYRYEVIPQARYVPKQSISQPSKDLEAVVITTKEDSLKTAFEMPPLPKPEPKPKAREEFPAAQSSPSSFEITTTRDKPGRKSEETSTDQDLLHRLAEKERMKQLERELQLYDQDESHKVAKKPQIVYVNANVNTPAQTTQRKTQAEAQTPITPATDGNTPMYQKILGSDNADLFRRRSTTDHRAVDTVLDDYLQKKIKHRQQLVENWAHQVASTGHGASFVAIDPELPKEDKKRLAKMAADLILDDIFKLALTRLLLQAEAGENTEKIMECLAKIQTTGNDELAQAMWDVHLSQTDGLQVMKMAAEFLPKPGDRGVLEVAEAIAKNNNIQRNKGKEDKATQLEGKVEHGTNTKPGDPQYYYHLQPLKEEDSYKDKERHQHYHPHHHHHHHHHHSKQFDQQQQQTPKPDINPYGIYLKKPHPLPDTHGKFEHIIRPSEIEERSFGPPNEKRLHANLHLQHGNTVLPPRGQIQHANQQYK